MPRPDFGAGSSKYSVARSQIIISVHMQSVYRRAVRFLKCIPSKRARVPFFQKPRRLPASFTVGFVTPARCTEYSGCLRGRPAPGARCRGKTVPETGTIPRTFMNNNDFSYGSTNTEYSVLINAPSVATCRQPGGCSELGGTGQAVRRELGRDV